VKGSVADEEEERDDYACLGASYVVLSSALIQSTTTPQRLRSTT
jgi:hypothetical protein